MEKLHTLSVICSMAAALTIGAASAAPAPAAGLSSSSALADAVEFRAQVTAKAQALLSSEMPGEVSAVAFRDGERFKAGDGLSNTTVHFPRRGFCGLKPLHRLLKAAGAAPGNSESSIPSARPTMKKPAPTSGLRQLKPRLNAFRSAAAASRRRSRAWWAKRMFARMSMWEKARSSSPFMR